MKFLGKWMDLKNIILSVVIQSPQKNTHCMHSLISGYKPKSSEYPRYNSQTTWSSIRRKTKVWVLQSFLEENKIPTGANMEIKCRGETEGEDIQRLSHLGIHLLYSYQTRTELWMSRSACWKEPDTAVSWDALPEPYKYWGWCEQPTIVLSVGSSIELLEKGVKQLKGSCNPIGRTTIPTNQSPPELQWTNPLKMEL